MAQLVQMLGEAPSAIAPPERRFYQPELDGLRFYAFLGVFVYHTLPSQAMPWLWGAVIKSGAAGVDLFFALSAFLITSLLLRERQQTGRISLRLFYLRRILRIWPLYFVVLALGVVLAHTVPDQRLPWYYIAGYLLFIGNWVSAAFGHPQSICSPLWTVSIEEQFYLVCRDTHLCACDSEPGRHCARGLERRLYLLRQRVALRLAGARYPAGALRPSSAPAYQPPALAVGGRGIAGLDRRLGMACRSARAGK